MNRIGGLVSDIRVEAGIVAAWWAGRRPAPWLPRRTRTKIAGRIIEAIHTDSPTWKTPSAMRAEAAVWRWAGHRRMADALMSAARRAEPLTSVACREPSDGEAISPPDTSHISPKGTP